MAAARWAVAYLRGLCGGMTHRGRDVNLDPQLLRADLIDFDLAPARAAAPVGLALKATGGSLAGLMHGLHLVAGLVLAVATYRLLRRIGTRPQLAATSIMGSQ